MDGETNKVCVDCPTQKTPMAVGQLALGINAKGYNS